MIAGDFRGTPDKSTGQVREEERVGRQIKDLAALLLGTVVVVLCALGLAIAAGVAAHVVADALALGWGVVR